MHGGGDHQRRMGCTGGRVEKKTCGGGDASHLNPRYVEMCEEYGAKKGGLPGFQKIGYERQTRRVADG